MTSTTSARLTCLCGAVSEPGSLLIDSVLPIRVGICHCNTCRRTTGSLGVSFPPLNSSPTKATLSKLIAYQSSEIITRYFCSKCGCQCFLFHHPRNKWYCLGGIIEGDPNSTHADKTPWSENTINVSLHEYISDTIDGGLAPLFLKLGGRFIPTWSACPGSSELSHGVISSFLQDSTTTLLPPNADSYLPAECHCGGVALLIKRANYNSSATSGISARYVPSDPTKWLSYFCACRSCRLSFGVSLTPWTLVLPGHVFNAKSCTTPKDNLAPVTFGGAATKPGANSGLTLKHHWSSPDVCRSFCGKCGATISYWCEKRPDELDLASGILRAEEGSMARRWLEWVWGRCSSTEECIDREICDAWVGSVEMTKQLEN